MPRLQGAVARVLPAIEAIVARLATGALHPREMERAGRALGVLTRTLRELNALLGERRPPAIADDAAGSGRSGEPADDDDGGPRDLEAFRLELIRRMNAIVAARDDNAEGGAEGEGDAGGEVKPAPSPRDVANETLANESVADESAAERGRTAERSRARPPGPQVRSV
ncbi:MAG: hypothetical protein AB7S93_28280 [Xanthobacteraceae bacterium]